MKFVAGLVMMLGLLASGGAGAIAGSLSPEELVGTWSVTAKVELTTCSKVKLGELDASQWLINYADENVTAAPPAGGETFTGPFGDAHMTLRTSAKGRESVVYLNAVPSAVGRLSGVKMVAELESHAGTAAQPCATLWKFELKKL